MKISNRKILENSQLIRQVMQKQLPVKISYAIRKNAGKFDSELETYGKEREKLLDEYAVKDEHDKVVTESDGMSIKFKDDDAKSAFQKGIEELLDIENEIDIRKFKLDDLGNAQFSPAEISAIDYMIEE